MIEIETYEYYYNLLLSEEEKKVYKDLLKGLAQYATSFRINRSCPADILSKIYEMLLLDHPEIFYVKDIYLDTPLFGNYIVIQAIYKYSKEIVEEINREVQSRSANIYRNCIGKSEEEKEKVIHDYLVKSVTYKDIEEAYSHEIYGSLIYGIGVCEGLSKSFKYLCDLVGLKSAVIVGKLHEQSTDMGHAWNRILLEGIWYNTDVTFDNAFSQNNSGETRYDYFNVPDIELTDRSFSHVLPVCTHYYSYYERKKLYAHSQSALKDIIKNRRKDTVSVQLPHFLDCTDKQLENYIFQAVNEVSQEKGDYQMYLYPNHHMNVFTIKISV